MDCFIILSGRSEAVPPPNPDNRNEMWRLKVSIKEIAKKTGFSPATVSLALNDSELVRLQTKERIQQTAREMGYVPNPYARKLVLQKSGMLGLIVPTISNVYYADLVQCINTLVRERDYGLIIATSDNSVENERKILEEMRCNQVEGVMLSPVNVPNNDPAYLTDYDLPLIFATARYPQIKRPCVMCNLEQGMYHLTRTVVEGGRKNLALVTGQKGVDSLDRREAGFRRAAEGVQYSIFRVDRLGYKGGCRAAEDLLAHGKDFDAVICIDDMLASGVINRLREDGRRIPEEVWVTGFDDSVFSKAAPVPITTVRQDIETIAEQTVSLLLDMIGGEEGQNRLLPCEIVRRASAPVSNI